MALRLLWKNKQRLALLFSLAKPIKERTPAVSPLYNNTFNTTQRDEKTDWINKMEARPITKTEQLNSLQSVNITRNTEMRQETTSLSVPMITTFKILLLKSSRKKSIQNQMVSRFTDAEMKQAFEIYNKDMLSMRQKIYA